MSHQSSQRWYPFNGPGPPESNPGLNLPNVLFVDMRFLITWFFVTND
jgi:hypothetical protein